MKKGVLSDVLLLSGCAFVIAGAAAIWWPLGLIACGMTLMTVAWAFEVRDIKDKS
jgi:uncharacterized membrane protein SpoIIM required for sporulation